ncbi:MAG: hypothetical protein WCX65_15160 [bacterium]
MEHKKENFDFSRAALIYYLFFILTIIAQVLLEFYNHEEVSLEVVVNSLTFHYHPISSLGPYIFF